jgi:hypothetical protein
MSQSSDAQGLDWIARWQRIARRIRVPLGFLRLRSISLNSGGARPARPPWPGAWRWFCPACGCAATPPAT